MDKQNKGESNKRDDLQHCPVLEATDWDTLLESSETASNVAHRAANAYKTQFMLLSPPATLARLIATYAPQLMTKPQIRVLCAGAEKMDTIDEGIWITSLCPIFLGKTTRIILTAVGDHAEPRTTGLAHILHKPEKAAIYANSLRKFLKKHSPSQFDLAVFFSPGFEMNRQWLDDGSFRKLVSSGLPIVATSLSEDDYATDKIVLQAYGYSLTAKHQRNPFAIVTDGPMAQFTSWSSIIWKIDTGAPPTRQQPDHSKLAALQLATNYTLAQGQLTVSGLGDKITCNTEDGTKTCRTLLANTFLTEENEIAIYNSGAITATGIRIRKDVLPQPPPDDATPLEKAVWAAEVTLVASAENLEQTGGQGTPTQGEATDLDDIIDDSTIATEDRPMPPPRQDTIFRTYRIRSEQYMTLNNCKRMLQKLQSDGITDDVPLQVGGPHGFSPLVRLTIHPDTAPAIVSAKPEVYNSLENQGLDINTITFGELKEFIDKLSSSTMMPCIPIYHVELTDNIEPHDKLSIATSKPVGVLALAGAIWDKSTPLFVWLEPAEQESQQPTKKNRT